MAEKGDIYQPIFQPIYQPIFQPERAICQPERAICQPTALPSSQDSACRFRTCSGAYLACWRACDRRR